MDRYRKRGTGTGKEGHTQRKRDMDTGTGGFRDRGTGTEREGQRERDRLGECATKPTLKMHTGEKQISTRIWLRQEGEMAMTQAL